MSAPTVLVFGSTGAIGGALVKRLQPDHAEGRLRVIGATRRSEAVAELEQLGIEARLVDLDDAEHKGLDPLVAALEGVDRVFLLTSYDVRMLAQSKAVVDAARVAGVQHIVHLGAYAAADTTIVHLGWHQIVEAYIAQSGIAWTSLQPTSFMQNLFLLQAVGGAAPGTIPHYIGDAATSWVDTEDVAEAAAAVLRDPAPHAGQSYLLGAERLTMADICETLADVTGQSWEQEQRSPEQFYETVTGIGADPVYFACVRTIFQRTAEGTLPDLEATSGDVEKLTGRSATTIRAFAERHREQLVRDEAVATA